MLLLSGGHFTEFKEALVAGLPFVAAAVGVSLLLVALAAIPPSALPSGALWDFLVARRQQVALAGASVCLSAAMTVAIVFWVL